MALQKITYNGNVIDEREANGNPLIVYKDKVIGDIVVDRPRTLQTEDTIATDKIMIGSAMLDCKDKVLKSDIEVTLESLELETMSWEKVAKYAQSGQAENFWAVGDTKSVLVNGTVGTLAVNATYYVYIIGFNHNGAAGIDFGTFKTAASGGVDICLVDSSYGSNSINGTKYFNMNHSANTNYGGWKGCDLRYDILGSTDTNDGDATETTATNPVANTLMAALPADLREVMKPMTIYTDNTGGGADNASYVTASIDYLPLAAEFEIFGTRSYANSAEQNYQKQYDYYKAGNSRLKYRHNAISSKAAWWGRSVYYSNTAFTVVGDSGGNGALEAKNIYGLAPIFRV